MITVYGGKPKREKVGAARDYCPVCDEVTEHEIVEVFPLDENYKPQAESCGFEGKCPNCGLVRTLTRRWRESPPGGAEVKGADELCRQTRELLAGLPEAWSDQARDCLAEIVTLPLLMVRAKAAEGGLTLTGFLWLPLIVGWPALAMVLALVLPIDEDAAGRWLPALLPPYIVSLVFGFRFVFRLADRNLYRAVAWPLIAGFLSRLDLSPWQLAEVVGRVRELAKAVRLPQARLLRAADFH